MKSNWISVKDKMPEDKTGNINYLCWVSTGFGEYKIGRINEWGWHCGYGSDILQDVTHWMPLPEKPKEDR